MTQTNQSSGTERDLYQFRRDSGNHILTSTWRWLEHFDAERGGSGWIRCNHPMLHPSYTNPENEDYYLWQSYRQNPPPPPVVPDTRVANWPDADPAPREVPVGTSSTQTGRGATWQLERRGNVDEPSRSTERSEACVPPWRRLPGSRERSPRPTSMNTTGAHAVTEQPPCYDSYAGRRIKFIRPNTSMSPAWTPKLSESSRSAKAKIAEDKLGIKQFQQRIFDSAVGDKTNADVDNVVSSSRASSQVTVVGPEPISEAILDELAMIKNVRCSSPQISDRGSVQSKKRKKQKNKPAAQQTPEERRAKDCKQITRHFKKGLEVQGKIWWSWPGSTKDCYTIPAEAIQKSMLSPEARWPNPCDATLISVTSSAATEDLVNQLRQARESELIALLTSSTMLAVQPCITSDNQSATAEASTIMVVDREADQVGVTIPMVDEGLSYLSRVMIDLAGLRQRKLKPTQQVKDRQCEGLDLETDDLIKTAVSHLKFVREKARSMGTPKDVGEILASRMTDITLSHFQKEREWLKQQTWTQPFSSNDVIWTLAKIARSVPASTNLDLMSHVAKTGGEPLVPMTTHFCEERETMEEVISPSVPPTPLVPTMVQQLKALGKHVDIVMSPIPVVDDATFIEYVYDNLKEYTAANNGKSMPIKTIYDLYRTLSNGCTSKRERDTYLLKVLTRYPREFTVSGEEPYIQIHSPHSNLEVTRLDATVTSPPSQSSARADPAASQGRSEPQLANVLDDTMTRDESLDHPTSGEITCTSRTLSSSVDTASNVDSSWQHVTRPEDSICDAPLSTPTFTGDSHGDTGE